jgi:hypothetical protein
VLISGNGWCGTVWRWIGRIFKAQVRRTQREAEQFDIGSTPPLGQIDRSQVSAEKKWIMS